MMKCPLLATLIAIAIPNLALAQNATTAKELFAQAYAISQKAQTEAEFEQIIQLCEAGVKAGPTEVNKKYADNLTSWAINRRGELRSAEEKDEAAMKDFEEAIRLNANNWRAIHNRGVSLALAGQNDAAFADFNKTISLEPGYANAYFNRGEVHSARGKWNEAIADYSQAIRLNDRDAKSLTNRGYAYYQIHQLDQALADYARAIVADKQWAPAYVHRGALHGDLGRWEQAATDYRTALQIAPDYGLGHQQAAWMLATCPEPNFRDPKLALDAARRAIELDGDGDFHYLDTLGAAYAANGQFDQAIAAVKKGLDGMPAGFESFKKELESRQKLYEQKQPYVEPKSPAATAGSTIKKS